MSSSLLAKLLRESDFQESSGCQELGWGLARASYGVELASNHPRIALNNTLDIMVADVFLDTVRIPSNIGINWLVRINCQDWHWECRCSDNLNKFLGKLFGVNYNKYVVILKIQPAHYPQYVFHALTFDYTLTFGPEHAVGVLDFQKPELLVWDSSVRRNFGSRYLALYPFEANIWWQKCIVLTDYIFVDMPNKDLHDDFTFQLQIGSGYDHAKIYFKKQFHIGEGQPLSSTTKSTLYAFCLDALSNDKQCVKKYIRKCMKYLEDAELGECTPGRSDLHFCYEQLQRSSFPANIQIITSIESQTFPLENVLVSLWQLKIHTYTRELRT